MLTIDEIMFAAHKIAKEYPLKSIRLFGSYAENRNTDNSDVDILIEFKDDVVATLLTLCKIKNSLEEILNVPVDVISFPLPDDSMLEIKKVVSLYAA